MNRRELIHKWSLVLPKELLVDLEAVIQHHVEIGVQAKTRMRKAVEPAKPPKRFDRERFEAMLRAVLSFSGTNTLEYNISLTERKLAELDKFYESKDKQM